MLEDLIEPGTSQGTRTLNPWQNPEPMMTTHLKRDNERKMGVGGLGQPTESADASKKSGVCQENCVSYFSFIYKFLYLAILLGAALYNGYTLGYAQSLSADSFSLVFSRRLFFWGPGVWDPLSRVRADKRIYLISLLL